jgi:hypothetical protein
MLGNRRLRLYPNGVIESRSLNNKGEETQNEQWKPISFSTTSKGYMRCCLRIDGIQMGLFEHRIVYYAHNQDWDIWDSSSDNVIDHRNRKKDDNRIENLKLVTQKENCWNTDAKGYCWREREQKWEAYIGFDWKSKFLGSFDTEEEAHQAYLDAKATYHV